MQPIKLTNEYIRGLIEGEGCFTFHTVTNNTKNGKKKYKIPAFVIEMHERDTGLITAIRDRLDLRNKIYRIRPVAMIMKVSGIEKIYRRGYKARLCVRDFDSIKEKVIPFFYKRLMGFKGIQFNQWLERMGADPDITESYRLLYRLYKSGYFDRNTKY